MAYTAPEGVVMSIRKSQLYIQCFTLLSWTEEEPVTMRHQVSSIVPYRLRIFNKNYECCFWAESWQKTFVVSPTELIFSTLGTGPPYFTPWEIHIYQYKHKTTENHFCNSCARILWHYWVARKEDSTRRH